jgi:Na+-transporting NADH:ubiquinone oxidoreductase subunit F
MDILTPIILLSILLIVTTLIIVLDVFLGNKSSRSIIINNEKEIAVTDDDTLLNILSKNSLFIPSACGGKATCGLCKCIVTEGGGDIKSTELAFIKPEDAARGVRLSCQVKVRESMKIEIPDSMLSAKEYKTVIDEIKDLTYDIKLVRFKLLSPQTMDFKPGQYAQLKVPGIEIIRAYSIASNPSIKDSIEMIIRYVPNGAATSYVFKALQKNDKVTITGPYGNFFLQEESERDIVCIAGGSGKAPIRSILFRLKEQGMNRKVRYFFGARALKDLYYTEELKELQREYPNFEYIPALSAPLEGDNWDGEKGLITDVLDRMTGDLKESEAYLCGSPGMIDACIVILKKHDIQPANVYYDKFS